MTTATTHAGFLTDIIAYPQDDDIRLIYADWLEENGQSERAEFVRVQIKLAKMPSGAVVGRDALRRRERELLSPDPLGYPTKAPWAWMGGAHCIVPDGAMWMDHVAFRRGFVAEVHCTLADWIGGECPVCDGHGKHRLPYGILSDPCGTCHGSGRIGGHGTAIVKAAPLERVVITGALNPIPNWLMLPSPLSAETLSATLIAWASQQPV
jgi:uncharacterized protein (TIGR02996 family)